MTAVTLAQFRAFFPVFQDTQKYPEPQTLGYLALAERMVDEQRWGETRSYGIALFVAHMMTRLAFANAEAAANGIGGLRGGMITSESAESASVSYDASSSTEEGAGHWNSTEYGRQYIHFVRMFGAGPLQVCTAAGGADVSASGWAGAIPWGPF